MRNISYESVFDLLENGHAGDTHFQRKIFTQRLILTQGQTRTQKWDITGLSIITNL